MGLFGSGGRGLFGNSKGGGREFSTIERGLLGFFGGPAVATALARRRQLEIEEAEERREAEAAARQQHVVDQAINTAKAQGTDPMTLSAMMMDPESFASNYNTRHRTDNIAPGNRRFTPGLTAEGDRSVSQPTTEEQKFDFYNRLDPELARAFAAKDALQTIQSVDPATGQTIVTAVNPAEFFPGLGGGQQGAPQQGQGDLPRPTTQAERDRLPPGTRYIAPDGSVKVTRGGASPSNGSGGFPGWGQFLGTGFRSHL